ncbi:hypothetical protein BKA69DRAFT_1121835 [Paraphysoderma sedebokerense]|nr:hypothetical protein BKA69DRAFT_1121835 [Paraphysoderma sedebokerense]
MLGTDKETHLKKELQDTLSQIIASHPLHPFEALQPTSSFERYATLAYIFYLLHERDPGCTFNGKNALTVARDYADLAFTLASKTEKDLNDLRVKEREESRCIGLVDGFGVLEAWSVIAAIYGHTLPSQSEIPLDHMFNLLKHHMLGKMTIVGRCSLLYCRKFLLNNVNKDVVDKYLPEEWIKEIFEGIIAEGKETALSIDDFDLKLAWKWENKLEFGIERGFAGIVATLLQFPEYLTAEDANMLMETLHNLRIHHMPTKDVKSDAIVGMLLVYLKAYQVFGIQEYLKYAEDQINLIIEKTYDKDLVLDRAIASFGYLALQLYKVTKNQIYLDVAKSYAKKGLAQENLEFGIWNGETGELLLVMDVVFWDVEVFKGFPGLLDV